MRKRYFRIKGRPFRGARATITLRQGFLTREEAIAYLCAQVEAGEMDPLAYTAAYWANSRTDMPVTHTVTIGGLVHRSSPARTFPSPE